MGLTWNPDFVKSPAGMAQTGQVIFAFVGGIVNIFSGDGLLGFAFWSTLFISGFLLLMHICNMAQSIEAGFPYFSKVELGYAVIWGIVFIVASIIGTITFAFSVLFAYVCTIAFGVDAFFKLKNYRERMANQQAATGQQQGNVEAGAHPAANAAAGATTY